jgi:hypothetical protein
MVSTAIYIACPQNCVHAMLRGAATARLRTMVQTVTVSAILRPRAAVMAAAVVATVGASVT